MPNDPFRRSPEDLSFSEFLKMFATASLHKKLLLSAFVACAWVVTSCEWISAFRQVVG